MENIGKILWNSSTCLPATPLMTELYQKTEGLILKTRINLVREARNLLITEKYSAEEFTQNGIFSFLLECLDFPNENLQADAIGLLHLIYIQSKGSLLQTMIDAGVAEACMKHINLSKLTICSTAVSLLCKFAYNDADVSEKCRKNKVIEKAMESVDCKTMPYIAWEIISELMNTLEISHQKCYDYLAILFKTFLNGDKNIVKDSLVFLHRITNFDEKFCILVSDIEILNAMIPLLQKQNYQILVIQIFANLAQWQKFHYILMDLKVPQFLGEIQRNCDRESKLKIFSFIKMFYGQSTMNDFVEQGLIFGMLECLEINSIMDVTVSTLLFLIINSTQNQLLFLIKMNVIPSLLTALVSCTPKTKKSILDAFRSIFEKSDIHLKLICDEFKEYGGIEKVKLYGPNDNSAKKILYIVQTVPSKTRRGQSRMANRQ